MVPYAGDAGGRWATMRLVRRRLAGYALPAGAEALRTGPAPPGDPGSAPAGPRGAGTMRDTDAAAMREEPARPAAVNARTQEAPKKLRVEEPTRPEDSVYAPHA